MVCEMCGSKGRTKLMTVDGAPLQVCQKCERFATAPVVKTEQGRAISTPIAERLAKRERRRRQRDVYEMRGELVLVVDYGARVRGKRRQMGLNQEELAKKVREKKSIIVKVENQDMRPSDSLIKTLERALGISLKEAVDDLDSDAGSEKEAFSKSMTLGDFIRHE